MHIIQNSALFWFWQIEISAKNTIKETSYQITDKKKSKILSTSVTIKTIIK